MAAQVNSSEEKKLTHDADGSFSNRLLNHILGALAAALLMKYLNVSFDTMIFAVACNTIVVIFLKVFFNK